MANAALAPVFVLAAWTSLVLLLIPSVRIRAGLKRQIRPDDFKLGESDNVPDWVRLPNRNYMNLLELPLLFYVVCLMVHVTGTSDTVWLALAWLYVGLRVVHSVVHLTYNHVIHRLVVFASSNAVLLALWVMAGIRMFGA